MLVASTTEIISITLSSISLIVAMLAYYRTVPRLKFILMKSRLLKNNNETITLRVYFTISNQTNAPANIFHIACFSHKKNFNVSDPTEKWGRFQPIYLSAYESQPYIVSADF